MAKKAETPVIEEIAASEEPVEVQLPVQEPDQVQELAEAFLDDGQFGVIEYTIVTARRIDSLVEYVNAKIKEGFTPEGAMVEGKISLYQTMVKYA